MSRRTNVRPDQDLAQIRSETVTTKTQVLSKSNSLDCNQVIKEFPERMAQKAQPETTPIRHCLVRCLFASKKRLYDSWIACVVHSHPMLVNYTYLRRSSNFGDIWKTSKPKKASVSALAASAVPGLVMARGHGSVYRWSSLPENCKNYQRWIN